MLNDWFVEITLMIFVTVISFFIYLTTTDEPVKSRVRGGLQGALISSIASLPTWYYLGGGNLAALVFICIIYCVSGQFLIEPIQTAVPKYFKKLLTKIEALIDKVIGG